MGGRRPAVEALFDRRTAHGPALRNLLQRHGYASLDEVIDEGREAGREEVQRQEVSRLRTKLRAMLAARGFELDADRARIIDACQDPERLTDWMVQAATVKSIADVL